MTTYAAWNDALAARFFRPDFAGQPVYFFVTEDVISEVASTLGGDVASSDFIDAVRAGPPEANKPGHCQRALQLSQGWRQRGLTFPPYVAYLGLFVLAGGHEGDFAAQSYYPRLRELLGEPGVGTPPSFERMLELWDDLERWSVHDRHGELGLFEARIVGGKIHIGLPLAQTVLTGAERHALPRIFADAGLDARRAPSTQELRRALSRFGRQSLRPRTMSAVERGSEAIVGALLDVVASDFLAWDGSTSDDSDSGRHREVHAGLRVCLSLDRVSGAVHTALRCRSRSDFPEEGLRISGLSAMEYLCTEFVAGWSVPLAADTGEQFQLPAPAWQGGLAGSDSAHGWTLRLAKASVRVFVDGSSELLPGLVEVLELPQDGPFYIAFAASVSAAVAAWVSSDCDGWRPIDVTSGLPPGWSLGSVRLARSDGGLRSVRPDLGFPDRLSMRFVGGIRAAAGNTYFSFAPPRVVLDGARTADRLQCDGSVLKNEPSSPSVYSLPEGLPVDSRIGLEVWRGEDTIGRTSIYLVSGFPWRVEKAIVSVDRCGDLTPDGTISGASAPLPGAEHPFVPDLLRTPGLPTSARRIYFIGREPGQIAIWPVDAVPSWRAVWAVPFDLRGHAVFCGLTVADSSPLAHSGIDRARVRMWRDFLWQKRRDITPPRDRELKVLWRRYRESARG